MSRSSGIITHQPGYTEWLMRDKEGKPIGNPIYEPGFYQKVVCELSLQGIS
jgi:hypothetical protein